MVFMQDTRIAWCLYFVHVVSMPCMLFAASRAMWQLLSWKRESPVEGVMLRREGEFIGGILLSLYPLFDAIRGFDLCFDSTDGICRSVWGIMPIWGRMLAWFMRDVTLLVPLIVFVDCTFSWTHAALGRPPPRAFLTAVRWTGIIAVIGVAATFLGMISVNRQAYQSYTACFLLSLNLMWTLANARLLRDVFPALEKLGVEQMYRDIQDTRFQVHLMGLAGLLLIILFPCMLYERLVLKGAYNLPVVPEFPLDTWVGAQVSPLISTLPSGIYLNPALEIIEVLIAWLVSVHLWNVGSAKEADSEPRGQRAGTTRVGTSSFDSCARGAKRLRPSKSE